MDFQDLKLICRKNYSTSYQKHYFQKYINPFLIHNTFPHFNNTYV